jgi:hypothetical protein
MPLHSRVELWSQVEVEVKNLLPLRAINLMQEETQEDWQDLREMEVLLILE